MFPLIRVPLNRKKPDAFAFARVSQLPNVLKAPTSQGWDISSVHGYLQQMANQSAAAIATSRRPGTLSNAAFNMAESAYRGVATAIDLTVIAASRAVIHRSSAYHDALVKQLDDLPVRAIAWHPHRQLLALVHRDNSIHVVDLSDMVFNPPPADVMQGGALANPRQRGVTCVAWRPMAAKTLAVGCEGGVQLWNIGPAIGAGGRCGVVEDRAKAARARKLPEPTDVDVLESTLPQTDKIFLEFEDYRRVTAMAWSPDGRLLAVGYGLTPTILIWDVAMKTAYPVRLGVGGATVSLEWSADGMYLCQVCLHKTMRIFETDVFTNVELEAPPRVGGIVKKIEIDPLSHRVAVTFEGAHVGSELIALFKVVMRPLPELEPLGVIRGPTWEVDDLTVSKASSPPLPRPTALEYARAFDRGALLCVCLENGAIMTRHPAMAHLTKLKTINFEDSNIANLGSDLEKKARLDASQHEKAWEGVGTKVGLKIWRIEQFKVVAWSDYGMFYSGDSYIVLNTWKKPDAPTLYHDIHFWLGLQTSQDEAGTAAYKTVELDDFLGTIPVQYREVQGFETPLFLSYFKNFHVQEGGVDTGFRHVTPETYRPRLFQVRSNGGHAGGLVIREVPLASSSLNSGDVFILDTGLKILQWNGSSSSGIEKARAAEFSRKLSGERKGCAVEVFDEGDADASAFWSALGGKGPVKSAADAEKERAVKPFEKVLLRLSDASGKMSFKQEAKGTVRKSALDSKDVFVFDVGTAALGWTTALAATSAAGLTIIIPHRALPPESALQRSGAHIQCGDFSLPPDCFEMPLLASVAVAPTDQAKTHPRPSDRLLTAFIRGPVFTLERTILRLASCTAHLPASSKADDPVRARYAVGDRVAMWRVVEVDDNQVLMLFESPKFPLRGCTWMALAKREEDGAEVMRFGSAVSGMRTSWVANQFHFLYSRILMATTVLTLRVLA
ncbi:hypothetical protein HK101_009399 [Irineochytrium annulatum]|nr:hypothetical protein HK101_009399 [Irineochytrium annulatum]